jgi:excisionase family DNA binding protein
MSVRGDFYTVQQAAQVLGMPTEKVRGLLRKGKLKAQRSEETGRWLLDVRSVHRRRALRAGPREASDIVIIGGMTLLAAGCTLIPLLFGG